MEIEYTLTSQDVVAFNRYHFMNSSAHVIPERFFASREQAEAFYQTVEKYCNTAHQTPQGLLR